MKITILGTGSFYANEKRSGVSYFLEADGKIFWRSCARRIFYGVEIVKMNPRINPWINLRIKSNEK